MHEETRHAPPRRGSPPTAAAPGPTTPPVVALERLAPPLAPAAHDEPSARAVATHFDPAFGRRVAERALDALAVTRGARVLDVFCGTGIFARLAARVAGPGGAVVGADPSAPALEVARRVDVTQMVRWQHLEEGRLPFADASFDVVSCQHALHISADPTALLGEMRRCVAPGGRIGITTWGPMEENPAFSVELDAAVSAGLDNSVVTDAVRAACAWHRIDDLVALAAGAGLTDVSCRTVRMLATLPPVAEWVRIYPSLPPLSAVWHDCDQQTRVQFLARAAELLRPFEQQGVLRVQSSSRLLVARAPAS
ncbi:MAG: class I SAM-dependent methyltransferase [Acidimicrobiales bacterium]